MSQRRCYCTGGIGESWMLVPVARIFGRTLEVVQFFRRAPFPLHLIAERALTLKTTRYKLGGGRSSSVNGLPCWDRTPGWRDTLLGLRRRQRRSRSDRTPAANQWNMNTDKRISNVARRKKQTDSNRHWDPGGGSIHSDGDRAASVAASGGAACPRS